VLDGSPEFLHGFDAAFAKLLWPRVCVVQQAQSLSHIQSSTAAAAPASTKPAPPPLPEEHRVLQDVFNQLVQLCTVRASHNPVSVAGFLLLSSALLDNLGLIKNKVGDRPRSIRENGPDTLKNFFQVKFFKIH